MWNLHLKNCSCLFLISVKYKHFRFAKIAVPQKRNVAWWAYFTNLVFRAVLHKIARRNFAGKLSCRLWLFTVSNISAKRTPVGNGTHQLSELFTTFWYKPPTNTSLRLSKLEISLILPLAFAKTRRRIPAEGLARLSNCRLLPLALAKSCRRIPALMSCLFAIGGFSVLQQLNLNFFRK